MRRSAKVQRFLLLGLSGPIIALNIWLLSLVFRYFEHLITVVAIAAILAFLMNYPVRILEQMRVSRTLAVVIVLLIAITILVISGLTLVPILVDQAVQLLKNIPAWLQTSNENLLRFDTWAQQRRLPINLKDFAGRINTSIESQVQSVATQAVGVALGTVSGFLELILVVVLAFYMLLYGDRVWQDLINLLPAQIGQPLSTSLRLNFQNFFLSQLLLGLFMVGTLTPSFLALKVPFSLLFALLIGAAELIPFIGATLGIGLVTLLVMLQDFKLGFLVAITSVIMQQIKDNFLAPKLLGDFTGLNPIWIFVAVLMGGKIAGLLGVIVSVPIAGTIKDTIDNVQRLRQPQVITTEVVYHDPS
jgi:predicted PurR-regulated permease PerM